MADIGLDPNINAWWLRNTPADPASVSAMNMGAQIAQHKMDMIRQGEQFKTSTALRLMDLSMEQERNDIALKTFNAKNTTDLLRQKGMAEIGNYLAEATKNKKLTDPETQAGFWRLTSQYAPFINEQTVNLMWDNTFKPAMDREARANGKLDFTITERDFETWKLLRDAEDNAPDADAMDKAITERKMFERMKGIRDPNAPLIPGEVDLPSGQKVQYLIGADGRPHIIRPPKEGLTPMQMLQYRQDLEILQHRLTHSDFQASERLNPKETDVQVYDRLRKAVDAKYSAMAPTTPKPTGTNAPQVEILDYDPLTGETTPAQR